MCVQRVAIEKGNDRHSMAEKLHQSYVDKHLYPELFQLSNKDNRPVFKRDPNICLSREDTQKHLKNRTKMNVSFFIFIFAW